MNAGRLGSCIGLSLSFACTARGGPDVDTLVANLTSEDAKTVQEAKQNLEAMGAEVVPRLFEKLLVADWTLRPRLLEVLSAHGREFAKKKLRKGNDAEKIYAALVYELTRAGEPDNYDTPEFKAMVEALLRASKSEDKYLRAAAIDAFLHDRENRVVFRYYHDLVLAMISSFDVDLVIIRRTRGGGFVTMWNICMALELLAGDRLAFFESESALKQRAAEKDIPAGASDTAQVRLLIDANRQELDLLREEFTAWWKKNSRKSIAEIGKLMIERNLAILEAEASPDTERARAAAAGLETWTGNIEVTSAEWREWWNENRDSYTGP